jgi:hypothetical protein
VDYFYEILNLTGFHFSCELFFISIKSLSLVLLSEVLDSSNVQPNSCHPRYSI